MKRNDPEDNNCIGFALAVVVILTGLAIGLLFIYRGIRGL